LRILVVGDIVGRPGRTAAKQLVPLLRADYEADLVIANAENAAAGFGITEKIVRELLDAQIDCLTTGNHCFAKKEAYEVYDRESRLLRPANYPPGVPGEGSGLYTAANGFQVGVVNLCGRVFMEALDCPFRVGDSELERLARETPLVVVDFHAEATSEKRAFAVHVDGRATAVVGTHTHVQTADEQVLPGGTAYITDLGMTGPSQSIIGMDPETVLGRFLRAMPARFEVASSPWQLQGAIIEVNEQTGRAAGIQRIQRGQKE